MVGQNKSRLTKKGFALLTPTGASKSFQKYLRKLFVIPNQILKHTQP